MIRRNCFAHFGILAGAVLLGLAVPPTLVEAAPQQQQQQPKYTLEEYNRFQAARTEQDPQKRLTMLDAFAQQFPNSTLMPYIDQEYIQTYNQLKNYPKVIEWADKFAALPDSPPDVGAAQKLAALQSRVQAFDAWLSSKPAPAEATSQAQLSKERDDAALAVKLLQGLAKPNANLTDQQWEDQKKPGIAFFQGAAGDADFQLKDNAGAIAAYKAAIAANPSNSNNAFYQYRIGLGQLALQPPQTLDGFWSLARAIDMKMPDADKVKDFLHQKILAYEQPGCDNQVDAQLNEMLQLAQNSPERPASYAIPSADDLSKIRNASNVVSIISDLGAGGDKAKMTWLAVCGSQFPEVYGKVIAVNKGDGFIDIMAFTAASAPEMQAATTSNMDVKVWTSTPPASAQPAPGAAGASQSASGQAPAQETPQPEVEKLQKDDPIKFAGTLSSYDPNPVVLHFDQVKVDMSIEQTQPEQRTRRRTRHSEQP